MEQKEDKHSLKGVLKQFIKSNKLQKGIDRIEARDAWKSIMGPGVSNYTTAVDLRGETLYISLSSSVLREELSLGRSKIIKMLNEELGKELVKRLVLR